MLETPSYKVTPILAKNRSSTPLANRLPWLLTPSLHRLLSSLLFALALLPRDSVWWAELAVTALWSISHLMTRLAPLSFASLLSRPPRGPGFSLLEAPAPTTTTPAHSRSPIFIQAPDVLVRLDEFHHPPIHLAESQKSSLDLVLLPNMEAPQICPSWKILCMLPSRTRRSICLPSGPPKPPLPPLRITQRTEVQPLSRTQSSPADLPRFAGMSIRSCRRPSGLLSKGARRRTNLIS